MNTHKPHAVYTKEFWSAEWVAQPYLYCNYFSKSCGPDTNEAELVYHYGKIQRPGLDGFATYTPLTLNGRYIKVVVDGGPTWYGTCVDQVDQRGGRDTNVITGDQTFICRGMEYFLQRTPIVSSWIDGANGEYEIGRAIAFNLGDGLPTSPDRLGNCSNGYGAKNSFLFAESLQFAQEWSAAAMIEYLFAYLSPRNQAGVKAQNWTLTGASAILENYFPTLYVHGKTLYQILNELVDRRRLMGWYVDVEDEQPVVRVFTFNRNAITTPGLSIPANGNQLPNWNFDDTNLVQQCVLATDDTSKFNRVIAKGEPPGGCFTVSFQNSLLQTDWTSTQQTAYDAGATGTAGYGAMLPYEKQDANQQARTKDYLRKVYRYFRIPPDFDGMVGASAVWPVSKTNTADCRPFWWPGLRLLDKLPLRTEHDYANPASVANATKTDSKWEYRRPFAFIHETGKRAYFVDRMSRGDDYATHPETMTRNWSANLRMQDEAFGFIVDVAGAPQHTIALNTFTAADAADETDYKAEVDYNYLYATVFAEGDGNIEEVWPPPEEQNFLDDAVRDLIIVVPNARLDYLVPNTVIDIDAAGDPVTTTGGFVRDDTEYLKAVARSSYEWYSTPRKSIQVAIHDLSELRVRGELIQTVGAGAGLTEINSVVTKVGFDLRGGVATYMTQFAELDTQ